MYNYQNTHTQSHTLTIFGLPCTFQPLCEVTHEVEEEVSVWHADDLVTDLDKEGEALRGSQAKTLSNAGTKVLGTST